MLPDILKEIGYNNDEIVFTEDIIKFIIKTYTHEAGVRKIKEKLMEIIREVNLNRLMNNSSYEKFKVHKNILKNYLKLNLK